MESFGAHLGSFRPPEDPQFTIVMLPAQMCPFLGCPKGVQNRVIFSRWVAFRSIVFHCCFGLDLRVSLGRVPEQKSSDFVRDVLESLGFSEGCKTTSVELHVGSILAPFLAPWVQFGTHF